MLDGLLPLLPEWLGAVAVLMLATLSPRFKRPPLVFKYARRDGMLALSGFAIIMVLAFIFSQVNIGAITAPFSQNLRGLANRMLLALVCAVPFIAALLVRKQPWRSIGWNRAMQMPALQLGFALAFMTIFLRGKFNSLFTGMNADAVNALWMWLVTVLAEETIFRGYLQLRFTTWWGQRAAWLGTAGLFLLWQLPRWVASPDTLVFNLVVGAVQALLCGWIMRQSGHVAASTLYRAVSEWLLFLK